MKYPLTVSEYLAGNRTRARADRTSHSQRDSEDGMSFFE